MKKHIVLLLSGVFLCIGLSNVTNGTDLFHSQTSEFATIRWAGRDNTHVIRPSGQVEFVASQLSNLKKPEHADDRSFYMNAVMNALAKEGYEFAGMTSDDIIMKRVKHQ
jgi:hypothetical protein